MKTEKTTITDYCFPRFGDNGASNLTPQEKGVDAPLATHSGPIARMSKPKRSTCFAFGDKRNAVESVLLAASDYSDDIQEQIEYIANVCEDLQEEANKLAGKLEADK